MKKSRNIILVLLTMVLMLIMLAACSNERVNDGVNTNQESSQQNNTSTNATSELDHSTSNETVYPLEVIDFTNTIVTLEQEPKRIVSLVPSETEIVFAIEGEDKLVGVNAYSDYPSEALEIESIGDYAINVETVVALEPDLIVASYSMNGDYIDTLRNLGLSVYVGDPLTYDETMNHISVIGTLLNKQEQANNVVAEMESVKTAIQEKVGLSSSRPKVYLEFSPGWTVGKDTFLDDLIAIAGGINISNAQSGWFEVNSESVIEANPAVIIYPNFGETESSILKGINERAGWQVIDAIQQNRIVEVSNEPLVRVGPRLTIGLQEIAKAIHPELFN